MTAAGTAATFSPSTFVPAPHLSLIVPAYNEVRSIGQTLDDFERYLAHEPYAYEIIVAADGNDGTRELVGKRAQADARLRVIGEPERGGKGRGIRNAVALASGSFIGFVDADHKTPIEELDKFWPWFGEGYDLVIGSRGLQDSRIEVAQPWYRRYGAQCFGMVMHALFGLRSIVDTQCGFKFFRGDVARDLFGRQRIDGYMFDVEVLWLAERLGYRIRQVGVRWRDDGDSRLQLVAGNWHNLMDLLRIRFSTREHRSLAVSEVSVRPLDQ
jgi:dolichyl-phosphate beta-glucosyltransferase